MAVHQRRRWIRVRHRRRAPRPPLSWPPGGGTRASPRAHAPRRHRRRDRGVRRSRASALDEPLGRRHHRSVRISRDRALRTGRDHAGVDLRGRGRARREANLDGAGRAQDDAEVLDTWRRAQPSAEGAPIWIGRLVLAADQFLVRRPLAADADGMTVIAGYHWFGDWGRDTMIALPGLTLATGRGEIARRILKTFAR